MTQERVLIVSAHPLFREGIIRLLGDQVEIIGAVADWDEAKTVVTRPYPQIVIVDHQDADLKEFDLTPLLWPDAEDLRVIYVTLAGDKMTIHDRRQVTGAGEMDLLRALKGGKRNPPAPTPRPSYHENSKEERSMDRSSNKRHLLVAAILVGIVSVVVALLLLNATLFQPAASGQASTIDTLMKAQLAIIAFLFALIVVFMLYSVIVFRRKPGDDSDGAHIHGNTKLEITWTILPLITVLVLGSFGARGLAEVTRASSDEMEVEVIAQKYAWRFNYPAQGIQNITELVVPVDQPLRLKVTSIDVIHNFWVPEFRIKQDAVPGLIRDLRIKPNVVGEYKVRCDELCGILHHAMLATVRVVEPAEFDAWVSEKVASAAAGPALSEAAQRGQELTVNNGCMACHNISGEPGGIGPTWKGTYGSEVPLADGSTVIADEEYIRSSIVNPNGQIHAGYPPGVMPQIYANMFSEDQLTDIIEYIKALADEGQTAIAQ